MKIGVSPRFAAHFPELIPAKDNPDRHYDITFCHVDEGSDLWIRERNRRLRPYFCASVEKVQEKLNLLHHK